ncbi:MAG: M16 family metallopeptidase [bacterium]
MKTTQKWKKQLILVAGWAAILISILKPFPGQATRLSGRVIEHTLSNGMKILILERHQSPTVSLYIRFRVGMVEDKGRGTAHFLEHMLFKGTETIGTTNYQEEKKILQFIDQTGQKLDNERKKGKCGRKEVIEELEKELQKLQEKASLYVVKDEMNLLYTASGAVGFNASTGADLTTYQVNLPSNRIELWARLESDRLANPVFREFYSERNVVMEERRQTNESEPFRKFVEQFLATAYLCHPYRHPIIGWESEIQYISKADMEQFFHTYYVPDNMVIAVVGDVDPEEFMTMVERYFGSIPGRGSPSIITAEEPAQIGERRIAVHLDSQPQLLVGYHKPTLPTREDYVFDVVDAILTNGRTSRLYNRLVEKDRLAIQVRTSNGMPGSRFPNLFIFMATPRHPHTVKEIEQAINEEIDRLKNELVSDRELQKVKNQLIGDYIRSLKSNSGLASRLSYFESVAGDWKYIDTHLEEIDKITPQEIQETVRKFLISRNRTVSFIVPAASSQ